MKDSPYPVFRMSLEGAARDFHVHVSAYHKEVEEFIEKNIPLAIADFMQKGLPDMIARGVQEEFRHQMAAKLRQHDIKRQIADAIGKEVEKAVREAIRDCAMDEIYWSDDQKRTANKLFKSTKAFKAIQMLWKDEEEDNVY